MVSVKRLGVADFVTQVIPRLAEREAENNLIIGLATRIERQPETAPGAVFCAVFDEGELVGAALRTPPQFAIVTQLPAAAVPAVADFFVALGDVPDGAIGPEQHGRALAELFAERLGRSVELASDELIYELHAVRTPVRPPGFARLATDDDLPLVTRFMTEFFQEVVLPRPPAPSELAQRIVADRRGLLWEDGEVRSIACRARHMLTGSAIAPVYTPPTSRGRGYGSAVTAELCQQLLDSGRRFVCLHANRKNRTSNHIYQAIGFHVVTELNVWAVR